jgi:beta-lactamase superfamily II metal-dependent hydrolase
MVDRRILIAGVTLVILSAIIGIGIISLEPSDDSQTTTSTDTSTTTQTKTTNSSSTTTTSSTTSAENVTITTTVSVNTTQVLQQSNVTVHFIDVGQGDAIFIDTGDKDVLIDGGKRSQGDVVVNYLSSLGITELDYIVATHPDADHIGGLIAVMQSFTTLGYPINMVLDNGQSKITETYLDYKTLADEIGVTSAERGQKFQLDILTEMTILSPTQPSMFSDYNDNSVVVMIRYNSVSFLLPGDLEQPGEGSILGANLNVSATLLKVGHHGSNSSTTEDFLTAVNPEVAVISVGEVNQYKHPHQETLDKLNIVGVKLFRTDIHGSIFVTTDGVTYSLTTEFTPESPESPPEPETIILINEVELNPSGQDSGNEWVELYNPTEQTIDISEWSLATTSGEVENYIIPQGTTIGPNNHLIIMFTAQFLDNSNESVVLKDNLGNKIDQTLPFDDGDDSNNTWQRRQDAADEWVFKPATKEETN